LDGVHYDAQHAAYNLACSNGSVTVSVPIMSEWVDEALGKGVTSRRRIKHALRDAFKIQAPDDDDA
jgi:predicted nucleotidyltransferase